MFQKGSGYQAVLAACERLEERRLLNFYTVTTFLDDNATTPSGGGGTEINPYQISSLRGAIRHAGCRWWSRLRPRIHQPGVQYASC